MIINSTGITKSNISDYLGFWTTKLREVYGNSFVIKKEGVVDNIATSASLTCLALEDVMLYLSKQMNPYTAEGEFQDALYALIGLTRRYASYTVVTRTIAGTANTVCDVGSVRFKNTATEDIFELNTAITIGESGTAVGSFTAIELGAIDLSNSSLLEIVDAPEGIASVYYSVGNTTTIGDDYEDDSEFRARWLTTQSVPASSNTVSGLRTALLELVDNNAKNLKIRQNRNNLVYADMPLATINVVLKSGYSDNDIAKTILNHVTDGVGLFGTTTVTLQDSEGTDVDIKFTRASELPILFNVKVVLNSGYPLEADKIKSAIIDNFDYGMGEKAIANDFYQYINSLESIDYVDTLEVKESGGSYGNLVQPEYYEYTTVTASNITVTVKSVNGLMD